MKPIHPGAILREDVLKPYNLTITDVVRELQISRKQLSEIVNEKSSVTTEMAIRFEYVIKHTASLLSNVYSLLIS